MAEFMDLIQEFADYQEFEEKSSDTIRGFRGRIKRFAEFVDKEVEEVTTEDVQSFLYELKKTMEYISVIPYHTALKSFFRWLIEVKKTRDKNPVAEIKMKKACSPPRHFLASIDDIAKLFAACRSLREKVIIGLGCMAGLRAIEIWRLKLEDIKPDRLIITGKGGRGRRVKYRALPLDPTLRELIDEYLEEFEPTERLIEVCRNQVVNIVQRVSKRAGVKATPHILRHTFATWCNAPGIMEAPKLPKGEQCQPPTSTRKNFEREPFEWSPRSMIQARSAT